MHLSGKLPLKQGIPIKVVVDDHVDRSGVKALQGVQLTDTNYLIDFIHLRRFIVLYLCVCSILHNICSLPYLYSTRHK